MKIIALHPGVTLETWGFLPGFLVENDPRPAREQFHERYGAGGGWQPMEKFTASGTTLMYPGDPAWEPISMIEFRDERIYLYDCSIVAVFQPDGSFEVARMD